MMNEKLFAVLRDWRQGLLARSLPAPSESDLRTVSDRTFSWTLESVDPVTVGYRDNIDYLTKQVRFGVHDPVAQADDDIWIARPGLRAEPVPPPPPSRATSVPKTATTAPPVTPESAKRDVYAELIAWADGKRNKVARNDPLNKIQNRRFRPLAQPGGDLGKKIESLQLQRYENEIRAIVNGPSTEPSRPSDAVDPEAEVAQPASSTPVADPEPAHTFDPAGFAPYDYSAEDPAPAQIRILVVPDKSFTVSWQPRIDDHAAVKIYRVVIGEDGVLPHRPDVGRLVAATTATEIEDPEPFTSSLRGVTVWCNSGADERSALAAQPYLHGRALAAAPVANFELREDGGTVIGEWDVFRNTTRTQVFRVPAQQPGVSRTSAVHRILTDEDTLFGFEDHGAKPGTRYQYVVQAEVRDQEGTIHLSAPVTREHTVSVVLQAVEDLEVVLGPDHADPTFDVSWTPPPTGEVIVYRSETPPLGGIEDDVTDIARLAPANLRDEDKLPYRARAMAEDREGLRRVKWPARTSRVYFTPVTVHEQMALVGKTVAITRVQPVTQPVLRERVNEQLLTFAWPAGAAAVWVVQMPRHADPVPGEELNRRPDWEIDREMWEQEGGLHFIPPLHLDGCALHLYSVAFQAGETFKGSPVNVDYPGLRRIRYTIALKRAMMGRSVSVGLKMWSDSPLNPQLDFALIHNAERFPLYLRDGEPLPLRPAGQENAPPSYVLTETLTNSASEPGWTVDISGINLQDSAPHFIRLFVQVPSTIAGLAISQIAVLDPPINELRLQR
jgi:hypothetical protein